MTTAQPARSRRALVESIPIVLTRDCLHLPPQPNLADPSRPWRVALWSGSQLRFQVKEAGDGVPVSLAIPRQPVSFNPPRWISEQTIRVVTSFIPHPAGLRRCPWFRCPQRSCGHRVTALFLFLDGRQTRFLCRHCLSLLRPSDLIGSHVYQAAKDPFRTNRSLSLQLRALALWYRWGMKGKWSKVPWHWAEQVTG